MKKSKEQLLEDYKEICEAGFIGTFSDFMKYLSQFTEKEKDLVISNNEEDLPF